MVLSGNSNEDKAKDCHSGPKHSRNMPWVAVAVLVMASYYYADNSAFTSLRNGRYLQAGNVELLSKEEILHLLENHHQEHHHQQPISPNNNPKEPPASSALPSCQDLMSRPHSPYADGEILSRPTTQVQWVPRADGSRQLELSHVCTLKRYTAPEARQCLAGHHMMWIGDSLTRYLWLSLAHFLHKGDYPPRFGRHDRIPKFSGTCDHHTTEEGEESCSPPNEPNILKEGDFQDWELFFQTVGDVSGRFGGHIECHCAKLPNKNKIDNMHYASPFNENNSDGPLIEMTYYHQAGHPNLQNYRFGDCAQKGTCHRNTTTKEEILQRVQEGTLELDLPWDQALNSSIMKEMTPNVDVVLYNRGIWGAISEQRAKKVLSLLHQFANNGKGRCFYRSTTSTAYNKNYKEHRASGKEERERVRNAALSSGCGYLDYAHLLEEFSHLPSVFPFPPKQKNGKIHSGVWEGANVYWDKVHYQPWVYQELNNLLLNVLCNTDGTAA